MKKTTRLKKPQVPELEQLYLFDELGGRPKYGNEEMTSETDIPSFDSIMDDTHSAVVAETSARVLADRALQGEIDTIKAASDVVDIVGTYADLQAYDTSKLNDNDIIKVLEDETHDDKMSYYRWSASAEAFSYIGSEIPVEVLQTTGTSTTAVMSQNAVTENLEERAFKVLTREDANYPVNNPIGIAPWLLDDGAYIIKDAYVYKQYGNSHSSVELAHLFVTHWVDNPTEGYYTKCWIITPNIVTNNTAVKNIVVGGARFDSSGWRNDLNARGTGRSDGDTLLAVDMITSLSLDSPSSSESYRPATATAIRNLVNGSIDKKVITGTPDIHLRGTVGQLLEDTTNGKLYICTAVNPQGTTPESYTYTWEEVAISASVPSVVQTILGTSTTDVPSQAAVRNALFTENSSTHYTSGVAIMPDDSGFDLSQKQNICIVGIPGGSVISNTLSGTTIGRAKISEGSVYISAGMANDTAHIAGFGTGNYNVAVGGGAILNGTSNHGVCIGNGATISTFAGTYSPNYAVAIGAEAKVTSDANAEGSVALGAYSKANQRGEVNIGMPSDATSSIKASYSYASSGYRLLTGLYDPQNAHDAATKGYVDTAVSGVANTINTTDWNALWQ